jgi:metallo-beta-lactamase family protein
MASLSFLGATGTVTGSKFLLEHRGFRLLVDCGLFQGLKELRLRNWQPLPVKPSSIDAVVLTHAHLDHSGYTPLLVRNGFRGQVLSTPATASLCGVLLPDSGHIQEEDARFANKHGFSRHRPALPLYTEEEARRSLERFREVPFEKTIDLAEGISLRMIPAGHILGAAYVEVRLREQGGTSERIVMFTGDLGRTNDPLLPHPSPLPPCDHALIESTYGDRDHPPDDAKRFIASLLRETAERGGTLVIPAFAVGRTQSLLYLIEELTRTGEIAEDLPVFLDSPMAIEATRIVLSHPEALGPEMRDLVKKGHDPLGLRRVQLVGSVAESKALNAISYPAVIISASGMATGGRVLHHLAVRLPDPRNAVLLVGFQAAGTRGRSLRDGADEIKIHGRMVQVRARVETLDAMSAHADRGEIQKWIAAAASPPRKIHLVHGEDDPRTALAEQLRAAHGLKVHLPDYLERVEI